MLKKDINNGLKTHLLSGSVGIPFVWPNVKSKADRPYISVAINATSRVDPSLKGGQILRETGVLTLVVSVDQNAPLGEDLANDYAETLSSLFPAGTRLDITGGEITVQKPADIRGGFTDEGEWRVPVVVNYVAIAH